MCIQMGLADQGSRPQNTLTYTCEENIVLGSCLGTNLSCAGVAELADALA
jgi:hypothetical protein